MAKIIYDIGANSGMNIEYYLMKSDLVIAAEANPKLCREIELRFPKEIRSGRLIVRNVVVTDESEPSEVIFYEHLTESVLSQFKKPRKIENYRALLLPSVKISDLIKIHGSPYYIKIDVEHYDSVLLKSLFRNDIRPPFISVECQDLEILCILAKQGGYRSFKLLEGEHVGVDYYGHTVKTNEGEAFYTFANGSAGPFGTDLNGHWMSEKAFFRFLGLSGLGWKDIHATNTVTADETVQIRLHQYLLRLLLFRVRKRTGFFKVKSWIQIKTIKKRLWP